MKNSTKIILFLWFLFIVFEAPLRLVFFKTGMPFLIYVKDLLLLGLLLSYIFYITYKRVISKVFLVIFLFAFYGLTIGCLNKLNPLQVLFGFKILLSFFVGFISIYFLKVEKKFFLNIFRVFVPIILLGLILEYFFRLPWKGLKYEAFDFLIEGSRQWTTFGIPRLSGFGRASFETGILLFSFSAVYLVISYIQKLDFKFHTKVYDTLLLIMSFIGIIFTTSKVSIFAFLAFILFCILLKFYNNFAYISESITKLSIKSLLISIFLYGIIPPIFSLDPFFSTKYHLNNTFSNFLFSSYIKRIEFTWPDAFRLIADPLMFFTGRGLGGIGAAQLYLERNLYNPADNLYVYVFVGFGAIVVTILIFYLLYNLLFLNLRKEKNVYFFAFCLILFSYGATSNVIESPTLTMILGALLGFSRKSEIDNY